MRIFILLIFTLPKEHVIWKIKQCLIFIIISISIPLPWFILAFIDTGNPIFPLFSQLGIRNFSIDLFFPVSFIKTIVGTLLFAPDPISPVYLVALPIIVMRFWRVFKLYKSILLYSLIAFSIWYFTQQDGGTRFLVPYLPVFSLLCVISVVGVRSRAIKIVFVSSILVTAFISIIYRGMANARYMPVLLGFETKQTFLMKNLNFNFGGFYDENESIKKIVHENNVLVLNMHNLYYANFPYVIEEWGIDYKYVLIQNGLLPQRFLNAKKVYYNPRTGVTLYKL